MKKITTKKHIHHIAFILQGQSLFVHRVMSGISIRPQEIICPQSGKDIQKPQVAAQSGKPKSIAKFYKLARLYNDSYLSKTRT
jgi:hypothetical protein